MVRSRTPWSPGRITAVAIAALVLVLTGLSWRGYDSLLDGLARFGGLGLGGGRDGAVDILLVGTDSRTDAHGNPLSKAELAMLHGGVDDGTDNTDTIILIRVPNDGSSATAISIPRDSYVSIPGMGTGKINSAYGTTREARRIALVNAGTAEPEAEKQASQAGRQALIKSVAGLTGVTVDHYAEIGLLGFVLLTDAVNGVDVCLAQAVSEPLSGARFRAGSQTLNGAQALSFVRQRHELPRGDLDRIVRQQVFMAALAHKVLAAKTLSSPSKLSQIGDAVKRSVVLDDDWDIMKFAKQLQDIAGGQVKFQTIPVSDGNATTTDGVSIVRVEPTAVRSFVADLAKPKTKATVDPSSVTVDVANDSGIGGMASRVADVLGGKGFQRGVVGNYTGPEVTASVVIAASKDDRAKAVAEALGGLPIRQDTVPPGTVRVVLATDYAGPGALGGDVPTGEPNQDAPAITAGQNGPPCVN